jgi:hypothetical protein
VYETPIRQNPQSGDPQIPAKSGDPQNPPIRNPAKSGDPQFILTN